MRRTLFTNVALLALSLTAHAADGNRLTYLDELDPYYPSAGFPS